MGDWGFVVVSGSGMRLRQWPLILPRHEANRRWWPSKKRDSAKRRYRLKHRRTAKGMGIIDPAANIYSVGFSVLTHILQSPFILILTVIPSRRRYWPTRGKGAAKANLKRYAPVSDLCTCVAIVTAPLVVVVGRWKLYTPTPVSHILS